MSETPRTDKAEWRRGITGDLWVRMEFAKALELSLAAAVRERDEARMLCHQYRDNGLVSGLFPWEERNGQ